MATIKRVGVSVNDYRPVVNVMTWFLMATTIIGVTVKVWIKIATSKTLDADDGILLFSLVSLESSPSKVSEVC